MIRYDGEEVAPGMKLSHDANIYELIFEDFTTYDNGDKLPGIWVTSAVYDSDNHYLGHTYTMPYTGTDDPDGEEALFYGGGLYDEGMRLTAPEHAEARLDCFKAAELLYRHAAGKGNAMAYLCLGYVYYYDRCKGSYWRNLDEFETDEDYRQPYPHEELAFTCFEIAAADGLAEAFYKLGDAYKNGVGCEVDVQQAYRCYATAATATDPQMKAWDTLAVEKLQCDVKSIDPDFHVRQYDTVISSVLRRYIQYVNEVIGHVQTQEPIPLISSSIHDWWIYPSSISRIHTYSRAIREYEVNREAVREAARKLEDDDSSRLLRTYELSIALQGLLLEALQEYESKFDEYVDRAESILPGIFSKKDYCRSFQDRFGRSELDYYILPGNNDIVASMDEYVRAYKLEQLYAEFDRLGDGAAIANRFLGRHQYGIDIDKACDLSMIIRTNLGFGQSSYFNATLSYKGVQAINAYFVIFYRVAQMAEFSGSTYNYEVQESSFPVCFERIKDINDEFLSIGEARFVDRYFRQSLIDLAKLLHIVANSDTFLEVTTISRLNDLTGKTVSQLVPVNSFDDIDLELSTPEREWVHELCDAILSRLQNGEAVHLNEDARIDDLLRTLSQPTSHLSVLQRLIRHDLIRSEVISVLRDNDEHVNCAFDIVNELLPQETGMATESLEGYDLIDYRAAVISRIISLMERLEEIASIVNLEAIIGELIATSKQVCEQAQSYRTDKIAPRLMELAPIRDDLNSRLENLHEHRKRQLEEGSETDDIDARIQNLVDELHTIASEMHQLGAQDSRLESFVKSVGVLGT